MKLKSLSSAVIVAVALSSLCAQDGANAKRDAAAITRVKNMLVSDLQPGNPKVALEYFLQTQAGRDAKISWEVNDCGEQTGDPVYRHTDPPICVEADVEPARGGSLVLMIAVGTSKTGIKGKPTVFSISFKDAQGTMKELRRLSQIPLELQNSSGS